MSSNRRFNEQEITAIFKQASEAQKSAQRHLGHSEGLTLEELQQIGSEAGITPEFIAHAATDIARTGPVIPPVTVFGVPVGVSKTADLPGPLSDEDWDMLVVDLRETFQASGTIRREGSLRSWRNGNLHVAVEPTETGHRLSFRTLNGNMRSELLGGVVFTVIGIILLLSMIVSGNFGASVETMVALIISTMGLGSVGASAYRLPRWADKRARQMDDIARRVTERMSSRSAAALPDPRPSETVNAPLLDLETDLEKDAASTARTRDRTQE